MRPTPLILAVLLAFVLALVALWPAPLDAMAVVGHWTHPDNLSNHWLLVWVAERLRDGRSLLHNDAYYWPVGDYPLLAGNGSEGFVYAPFHALFGWPRGASVYALVVLVANGLAGWWSARRLGASDLGALVAAAAFGTGPYVLQELGSGRFSQADVAWVALGLGWFGGLMRDLRAGTKPRRGAGLVGGAIWGVGAALYWYHGWFVAIGVVALGLPHLVVAIRERAPGLVPWWTAAEWLVAAVAVVAWPLSWFVRNWALIPGTEEGAWPHPEAIGDSLAWQLPFDVSGAHQGAAISAIVLLLAGGRLIDSVRRPRPDDRVVDLQLVALLGLAILLARGPGLWGSLPGPFELFYGATDTLRRFWWPSRHLVLAHWALAVLAARGASLVIDRIPRESLRPLAALALALAVPGALMATSDLVRLPMSRFEAPPFYERVRDLPPGVLAEVPLSPELAGHQQALIYQLVHRKPLLAGHATWVDRVRPDAWDERLAANSFLAALVAWEEGRADTIAFRAEDLASLRADGFRWIAVNREYLPTGTAQAYERVLAQLFGPPVIPGAQARLHDVDRWTGLTRVDPPPFRLPDGARPSDGAQPFVATRPESLGFRTLREAGKPFQGLHPAPVRVP